MSTLANIEEEINKIADPERAKSSAKFFKTGKGEYGEGDVFLGLTVPQSRQICKKFWKTISLNETEILLHSEYHEKRLLALFILVRKFDKGDDNLRNQVYESYLKNTKYINNWDLVDSSAHYIVGAYLWKNKSADKEILYSFASSKNLWERRIAILTTFYFIKNNDFRVTLDICTILLNDKEDLIHKAVGWMLREIGNRNLETEEQFLKKYYKNMPRTMLRYAIEKFETLKRKDYLQGNVN